MVRDGWVVVGTFYALDQALLAAQQSGFPLQRLALSWHRGHILTTTLLLLKHDVTYL